MAGSDGAFKIVQRPTGDKSLNIFLSRIVLSMKQNGDETEFHKAPFVVGRHKDIDKSSTVYDATTMKQSSLRLFISIEIALQFIFWTINVNRAYLQSSSALLCEV